jgi:hypothetical protein
MSDDTAKRPVRVWTDVPTAEILALAHDDEIVARGVQKLETDLAPGIYQLRYRVGAKVIDQIFRVPTGEGVVTVTPPELPIDTAAPLPSTTLPPGISWAKRVDQWNETVDVTKGSGSHVFLFINQIELDDSGRLRDKTRHSVTVRKFEGEEIANLGQGRANDGSFCLGVELDPGNYLVRVDDGSAPAVEQTVVACRGWQTQLFFRPVASPKNPTLDLSQGALRMRSIANGLQSDDGMFRWTEAARQSLASWRYTAAPTKTLEMRNQQASEMRNSGKDDATLRQILHEKFGNPMLGIYGAHLIMCNPEPDRALLRIVVDNLRYLVGDHPDVMSVALFLEDSDADGLSFPTPPMLKSSWDLIVQRKDSAKRIPAGSYSFSIGGGLCGIGAGLAWRVPPAMSSVATTQPAVDWQALIGAVSSVANLPGQLKKLAKSGELTSAERALLGSLMTASLRVTAAKEFISEEDQKRALTYYPVQIWRQIRSHPLVRDTENAVRALSAAEVSKATSMPLSTLEAAAGALSEKLGVEPLSSGITHVIKTGAQRFGSRITGRHDQSHEN